jgi:hypothetical protein
MPETLGVPFSWHGLNRNGRRSRVVSYSPSSTEYNDKSRGTPGTDAIVLFFFIIVSSFFQI